MKKNKKNKLLNFWNKIKRPLMILSIIGNVLLLIIIIVACANVKKPKTQQVNAENESLQVLTLRGTTWSFNGFIRYSPNGHDLMEYRNDSVLVGEYSYEESFLLHYNVEDVNYSSGDNAGEPINFISITFYSHYVDTYLSSVQIVGYYFGDYGTQRSFELYSAQPEAPSDEYYWTTLLPLTNTDYGSVISIKEEYVNNSPTENSQFISWFYDNASVVNGVKPFVFTFNENINYNAPYAMSYESVFVNMYDSSLYGESKIYDFPLFVSNGQVFNRIKLYYMKGYAMGYLNSDGNVTTNDNQGVAYFFYMQYINTYSNTSVQVLDRNFRVDSSTYLVNGARWINSDYRSLVFQQELTPEQKDSLSQFNNNVYVNGFGDSTTNVGLTNVFSLLAGAFSSLTSLFAIQLLPGITIGLLIFMPLIVGLIITIIWLVKR